MTTQILSPEDQARANFYGLLARLFYASPDAELLKNLAAADDIDAAEESAEIAEAWSTLKRIAAQSDLEAVREEFEAVFVGTGKALVTPYATGYMEPTETPRAARHPLVLLREFLAARGLGRKAGVHEPEDHIAGLCEVMRHLVVKNDVVAQRDFYETFLAPTVRGLCTAITGSPRVRFYAPVARFAAAFFHLEEEAVKMD